jgi:cadmium resistance protein CadD (predicted permease)
VSVASIVGLTSVAFATTNVDNALATTAQLATSPPQRVRRIVAGQWSGFLVIVGLSAGGAAVLAAFPVWTVGLLGVVPITLGVRGFVALRRHRGDAAGRPESVGSGFVAAALVTVGNGGDNLAVYIPLLRQAGPAAGTLAVVWLLALDVALCGLAVVLGRHPRTLATLQQAGAWVTPLVYCIIGIAVLVRAGTLRHLF